MLGCVVVYEPIVATSRTIGLLAMQTNTSYMSTLAGMLRGLVHNNMHTTSEIARVCIL
jgi:hypothetical protein